MFFKPNTIESSTVRNILLNPSTNQVMVQFKNNAKTYLYENVNEEAIVDVFFGEITSMGKFVNAYCKGNLTTVVGWLSFINTYTHPHTMTTATLTDMQQRISEMFDIDNVAKVDTIIQELEGYGIESEDQLDDAFSGCYRDEATFCEDLLCECYSEAIDAMPVFLQTAIDWEMVWHQSMQYDYFAIYHDCEYYFFNRNF